GRSNGNEVASRILPEYAISGDRSDRIRRTWVRLDMLHRGSPLLHQGTIMEVVRMIEEGFMRKQPMTLVAVRFPIRPASRQTVVPAYSRHGTATLLAALVVANSSLDTLLGAEGCSGETAAERLCNASGSFSDYAGLRTARHVRDQGVHRLGYPLCRRVVIP